ncbi:MAG: carboxypeptidase regulatory-like domain-containing protein [candidate division NC10 bacterium]|nr:carboxypeptidase regulatory-like domain-containing protein [candidate division NC10 bacterium]
MLTDTLPPGVTFVSASAGCRRSGNTVTCNLGPLANGATATVTIVVKSPTAGTITNTATGRGIEADPNPASNTATTGTTVKPSCLRQGSSRLEGQVKTAAGRAIPSVTMNLSGPGGCSDTTTTNSRGKYQFKKLANGTYTVTPSKAGCTFTLPSRSVTIAGGTATADFTGSCP